MLCCSDIRRAVARYGRTPRHQLPGWARNPRTEDEFHTAFAIAANGTGVEPVCNERDELVAWRGIEIRKEQA